MSHKYLTPTYYVLCEQDETSGRRRQGFLKTSYHHLVGLFGEPLHSDGRTIDVQWIIGTDAGIGTIYNHTLLHECTTPVENITHWHVGGKNKATYRCIVAIVQTPEGMGG